MPTTRAGGRDSRFINARTVDTDPCAFYTAGQAAQTNTGAWQIVRCQLVDAGRVATARTTSQSTLGDMPAPHDSCAIRRADLRQRVIGHFFVSIRQPLRQRLRSSRAVWSNPSRTRAKRTIRGDKLYRFVPARVLLHALKLRPKRCALLSHVVLVLWVGLTLDLAEDVADRTGEP